MLFRRRKGGPQSPRGRIAAGVIWLVLLVPLVLFTVRARNWLFGAILAAVGSVIIRYTIEEVSLLRQERKDGEDPEECGEREDTGT